MNTKVGKDYILPGETRKRATSEVVWLTVWLTLFIAWASFILTVAFKYDFWSTMSLSKDTFAMLFICNVPTALLLLIILVMMKTTSYVRTTEYLIHQYEIWNWEKSKYETFYTTSVVRLYENYIYFFNAGDTINKMSPKELEESCVNKHSWGGFKTKDEAMIEILKSIKILISDEKAIGNVKIRNVTTLETFTVDELKEKFENGEFNHLKIKEE